MTGADKDELLEIGTIVTLHSGGPRMTVRSVRQESDCVNTSTRAADHFEYECIWFNAAGDLKTAWLHIGMLDPLAAGEKAT